MNAHDRLVRSLHLGHEDDGTWHAAGQLPDQKRPHPETNEVTTLWVLHALRTHSAHDEDRAARARAQSKMQATSTTVEHLMLRYLTAVGDGNEPAAASLHAEVLNHQNTDGGWGWTLDSDSDAIGTGQVLYGLAHGSRLESAPAVRRAQRFLAMTQQGDGSWLTPSTLEEKHGQPYVVSNDWGTAWAVIGLTHAMGKITFCKQQIRAQPD